VKRLRVVCTRSSQPKYLRGLPLAKQCIRGHQLKEITNIKVSLYFCFQLLPQNIIDPSMLCPCIIGAAIFLCPIAAGPSRESGSIIIVNHKDVDDFERLTLPNSMISVFCCPTVRRHEVQVSHRLSEALPTTFNVFSTASPSAPSVLTRFVCIPITDCHDSALVFDLRPDHTTTRHE